MKTKQKNKAPKLAPKKKPVKKSTLIKKNWKGKIKKQTKQEIFNKTIGENFVPLINQLQKKCDELNFRCTISLKSPNGIMVFGYKVSELDVNEMYGKHLLNIIKFKNGQ